MKKLFQAIRKGELHTVRTLLEGQPALIACTAKQPPKKDDGQSPLQVAVKCGQLEIAQLLLDRGADPGARDSYGNSAMERAVLDARQVLPACLHATGELRQNRVVTLELRADFQRIFRLLAEYGMDGTWPARQSGVSLAEYYGREPVAEFLR